MDIKYTEFTFVVENLSNDDADELLDLIVKFVESKNTVMGGGFHPYVEEV